MKTQDRPANQPKEIAQAFGTRVIQQIRETLALELQILELRNTQVTQSVGILQKRLQEQGHLNAVDVRTGEVLRDTFNMPLPLEMPRLEKPRVELIVKLLGDLVELLRNDGAEAGEASRKAPDIRDYQYIFKTKDDEN